MGRACALFASVTCNIGRDQGDLDLAFYVSKVERATIDATCHVARGIQVFTYRQVKDFYGGGVLTMFFNCL